jgi:hypothetical protein
MMSKITFTFFITVVLVLHASAGTEDQDPPSPYPFLTNTYSPPPPPQTHHAPPQPPATPSPHSSNHRNVGDIIGIVFRSVAGVAVIVTGLWLLGKYLNERYRQGRPVQAA